MQIIGFLSLFPYEVRTKKLFLPVVTVGKTSRVGVFAPPFHLATSSASNSVYDLPPPKGTNFPAPSCSVDDRTS